VASLLLGGVIAMAVAPGLLAALAPGSGDARTCRLRADDGSLIDRLPPSGSHWFGTDAQGCDVFVRVVYGARPSLLIGIGTALVTASIGLVAGVVAGYSGGRVDSVVRRSGDVVASLPFVVGAILLLSVLAGDQRSWVHIVVVLSVLGWPTSARLARSSARQVAVLPFVEASCAAGGSGWWIMRHHIAPHAFTPVVAFAATWAGLVIAAESTLTYLGVGLPVTTISWGGMIDRAQLSYATSPHLLVFPSLALVVTTTGFVLLGDAIRDALDPRDDRRVR
jgi:oligopeptide transport system permease protein